MNSNVSQDYHCVSSWTWLGAWTSTQQRSKEGVTEVASPNQSSNALSLSLSFPLLERGFLFVLHFFFLTVGVTPTLSYIENANFLILPPPFKGGWCINNRIWTDRERSIVLVKSPECLLVLTEHLINELSPSIMSTVLDLEILQLD